MATTDEIISKAEHFAMSFITKIKDASETPQRKQVYFMDNQDELRKHMAILQRTIAAIKEWENEASEDDLLLVERAESIITQLKEAISLFQKELMINSNTQEEDVTAAITEQTIGEALQSNKTTQEMSSNMAAIAEQRNAALNTPQCNYALMCDGSITLFYAKTKDELNSQINVVANQGVFNDIQLFQVQFTPVQLYKKTILSV